MVENFDGGMCNRFLVAERNSTSDPVCLFVCLFVCLSVCLFVCLFVCLSQILSQIFFTSSRRSLRWMSSTKATYLLQQENKIYYMLHIKQEKMPKFYLIHKHLCYTLLHKGILSVCLSVCLFVCLYVVLSPRLCFSS